jgi:hypothetical protein
VRCGSPSLAICMLSFVTAMHARNAREVPTAYLLRLKTRTSKNFMGRFERSRARRKAETLSSTTSAPYVRRLYAGEWPRYPIGRCLLAEPSTILAPFKWWARCTRLRPCHGRASAASLRAQELLTRLIELPWLRGRGALNSVLSRRRIESLEFRTWNDFQPDSFARRVWTRAELPLLS